MHSKFYFLVLGQKINFSDSDLGFDKFFIIIKHFLNLIHQYEPQQIFVRKLFLTQFAIFIMPWFA